MFHAFWAALTFCLAVSALNGGKGGLPSELAIFPSRPGMYLSFLLFFLLMALE